MNKKMKDQHAALAERFPQNHIITDGHGNLSVTVFIPRFTYADVIDGAPAVPHPAFVVNGTPLAGIFISKYQNVLEKGVACSLPDRDPAVCIDFDTARAACRQKGAGWHLMTAMEWGAIALWCRKNGHLPFGNNDLGKDVRESAVSATVSHVNVEKGICRVATGSGPLTWSHNGRADGIWDLNGNVWEWCDGLRLMHGEVQLCTPCATGEPDWQAIDARTGALVPQDGKGTTAHSVKLDFRNDAFVFASGEVKDAYPHARHCDFAAVSADSSLSPAAVLLLEALALLPTGDKALYEGVELYANNGSAERMVFRGGRWGQGLNAGLFKTCMDDPRTYAGDAVGFRAACYKF